MVRTSVLLDDALAARLRFEARRRNVSVAEVVREAVEAHLPARKPGEPLAFFAIGDADEERVSERVDELLGEIFEKRQSRR